MKVVGVFVPFFFVRRFTATIPPIGMVAVPVHPGAVSSEFGANTLAEVLDKARSNR
jgi:hypothetical protein